MKNSITWLTLALGTWLCAEPTSGADYTVPTDSIDAGGQATASADYSSDGSLGGIGGISSVASPAETVKSGYVAQLYEVVGLRVTAAPENVDEGATTQFGAAQLLDDDTTLAVPTASVSWSVVSGPLTSIDGAGLAMAASVYESTAATAQGNYGGSTSQTGVTVLNVNPDDYGSYAGDGLDDDWQVLYFGLDNPNAGPLLDPDKDGQSNEFEFIAGLIPTDSGSRFSQAIVPAGPGQIDIVFNPRLADRTYQVNYTTSLSPGSWTPLVSSSIIDNGTVRTVTDLLATGSRRFYHVQITKP